MISSLSKRNNDSHDSSKKLIYSFTKIFNAFAATLHEEEAEELANNPDVISIIESRNVQLHTTRSWDFLSTFPNKMDINELIWEKANHGEDMIIANVDTGVWPEAKSFSDEGYGPIPKKFKGECDNEIDPTFKCNRKLIGARFFYKGFAEALASANKTFPKRPILRDMQGHGTHTLSTAAGNVVPLSDSVLFKFMGLNNATIKGGSSRARVVAYKAVWPEAIAKSEEENLGFGNLMDGLAAVEAAIVDGVDIINLSMGLPSLKDENNETMTDPRQYYFQEPLSIASFHAMTNGILTIGSSGNLGPTPCTATNISPWILTVGASTLDRDFTCYVSLGNHQKIRAARYVDGMNNDTFYPIITGADAPSPVDNNENKIGEDDKVHEASPFAIGAGLIQPNLAMDPGLVYDMDQYDYLNFLCSYDSVSTPIKTFTKRHAYKCPKSFNILDFNYPSISVPNFSGFAIATRRLKNVGPPSTYIACVQPPPGISVVVEPSTLVFSKENQEIKFKLVFSTDNVNHLPPDYQFGNLVWSDGEHNVRSPIAVKPISKSPAPATKTCTN
ncbi:Subtilisin-like protease SBT5.3, partial [Bienertia sinuspersici]